MKKRAFTMAEVLITLGVIGIVAAMTIPNLVKKWEERAIIGKYKKMYSTLANAYNMAIKEHGDPQYWDLTDGASLLSKIEPYLNVVERCYNKKGCVSLGKFNALSGEERYGRLFDYMTISKIRLNGGFAVAVTSSPHVGCEYDSKYTDSAGNERVEHVDNNCGKIMGIITNTKGRNSINYLGKDHFSFIATKNGIYPENYSSSDALVKKACSKKNQHADGPNNNTNGQSCGTWILRYDNMDYFYE